MKTILTILTVLFLATPAFPQAMIWGPNGEPLGSIYNLERDTDRPVIYPQPYYRPYQPDPFLEGWRAGQDFWLRREQIKLLREQRRFLREQRMRQQ